MVNSHTLINVCPAACFLLLVSLGRSVEASEIEIKGHEPVNIYLTGRGILQQGKPKIGVVANSIVVSVDVRPEATPKADWIKDVSNQINNQLPKARQTGRAIEVLSIQNVGRKDHLFNNGHERQAEELAEDISEAVVSVRRNAEVNVYGIYGSNSTRTFAVTSLSTSQGTPRPVDRVVLLDGRAIGADVLAACAGLSSCTQIVSRGDYPSTDRIANLIVAEEAFDDSGYSLIQPEDVGTSFNPRRNLRLLYVDRNGFDFLGTSHVKSMQVNEVVRVKEYLGNGKWTDWKSLTDQQLLQEAVRLPDESRLLSAEEQGRLLIGRAKRNTEGLKVQI